MNPVCKQGLLCVRGSCARVQHVRMYARGYNNMLSNGYYSFSLAHLNLTLKRAGGCGHPTTPVPSPKYLIFTPKWSQVICER